MAAEPFKRITNVTPEIANNWQKHYVCVERQARVHGVACSDWRTILFDTEKLQHNRHFPIISARRDAECGEGSVYLYQTGWVITEYLKHVEVGVLVDHNEEHKTQLEVTTKIKHLPTGQLVGNQFTARLNEQIEMETPDCRISMTITEVPMNGGA